MITINNIIIISLKFNGNNQPIELNIISVELVNLKRK